MERDDVNYLEIDEECVALCKAINRLKNIKTTESCCGHNSYPFSIWFKVKNRNDLNELPILLYFIDSCHIGFDWDCLVSTDCAMSPASFRIQSRGIGNVVYDQAQKIAFELNKYLDNLSK